MTQPAQQSRPSATSLHTLDACFDPSLAQSPTHILPVSAVIDLLQVTHAPERIAEYRQAMERGQRFPPVSVVRLAGHFFLADGHKRFSAYRSLPVREICVEVWSTRRWLRDQWGQLARKTVQQIRLVTRLGFDRAARRQAARLFWDTVGHWRRLCMSIVERLRAR